jgi:hypothetical protein
MWRSRKRWRRGGGGGGREEEDAVYSYEWAL